MNVEKSMSEKQVLHYDESAYRKKFQSLPALCFTNNLTLNARKTKVSTLDFWESNSSSHSPVYINRTKEECVSSLRFLGVYM